MPKIVYNKNKEFFLDFTLASITFIGIGIGFFSLIFYFIYPNSKNLNLIWPFFMIFSGLMALAILMRER